VQPGSVGTQRWLLARKHLFFVARGATTPLPSTHAIGVHVRGIRSEDQLPHEDPEDEDNEEDGDRNKEEHLRD